MLTARFDPTSFFSHVEHVALCVPAGEVFSLLKRSIDLPATWGALIKRDLGDDVAIAPGARVESEGVESVLFVRSTPVTIELLAKDLRSRDGYSCDAKVMVRVSIPMDRGELRSFRDRVLGSHRVVHAQRLAAFVMPCVQQALSAVAAENDADALMQGSGVDPAKKVQTELSGVCFSSGLFLHQVDVGFQSASWKQVLSAREHATARHASHEAAREVDQALHKAREEHIGRLSGLLVKLRELSAANPDRELGGLIRTFDERQRGELYAALFAGEQPAHRTKWIIAASGDEVLFYAPDDLTSPARRLKVKGAAGALRSVQYFSEAGKGDAIGGTALGAGSHGNAIFLGAATGVYRLPIDGAGIDLTYQVADASGVRGGFNSVAVVGERIFAAHSELGIISWAVDQPNVSTRVLAERTQGAKAVREISVFSDRLYCAVEFEVISWSPRTNSIDVVQRFQGSLSTITAVCPSAYGLIAGNAEGEVLNWAVGQHENPERLHRGIGRPVESLWLSTSHGVPRLLFTDTSSRVHMRVWGDSFSSHAEAGGQTLRRVEVADDLLVATNEIRDRLMCWEAGKTDQAPIVLAISRLTGNAIQDVCLVRMDTNGGAV